MRSETEWIETVNAKWNRIVDANSEMIADALSLEIPNTKISEYGEGNTSELIVKILATA